MIPPKACGSIPLIFLLCQGDCFKQRAGVNEFEILSIRDLVLAHGKRKDRDLVAIKFVFPTKLISAMRASWQLPWFRIDPEREELVEFRME